MVVLAVVMEVVLVDDEKSSQLMLNNRKGLYPPRFLKLNASATPKLEIGTVLHGIVSPVVCIISGGDSAPSKKEFGPACGYCADRCVV